jgi:lysophospholipase L1-like esterase
MSRYLRYAALGDSTTYGIGDPHAGGWRGWAKILADALGEEHDVSFCNVAVSGATSLDLGRNQLPEALAHRPDLASLIVGVNDTMRSNWNPTRVRTDLLTCAAELSDVGAVLMTARFHDHGAVFGLPSVMRRPLQRRIEQVNEVYDEIFSCFGGVQLDLAALPEVQRREFWSIDRLHPSQLGHRQLARAFGAGLRSLGLPIGEPSLDCDGTPPSLWDNARWMLTEGAPWMGRRAKDLGPWAIRLAVSEARIRVVGEPVGSSA